MRKNASIQTVAENLFGRANKVHKLWIRQRDYIDRQGGYVESSEREKKDLLFNHFHDLDEISDHLFRLLGMTQSEIDARKEAARYQRPVSGFLR